MKTLAYGMTIFLLILLSGCASNYQVGTPSGRAEILINGVNKKDITDALVIKWLSSGYYILKQSDYQIEFGTRNTSFLVTLLAGTYYDVTPELRYSFNIVDYLGGVKVFTNIWVVSNPGSAFERFTDISTNSRAAQDIQSYFNNLKPALESNAVIKGRGKIGVRTMGNSIVEVVPGSPADKGGLKMGDVIRLIDGVPPADNDHDIALQITGEPGSVVRLMIMRGDEELIIDVERGQP